MKLLAQLFASLRRSHRRQAAIRELSALPDWILKDIGVHRAAIPAVVDATLDAAAARSEVQARTQTPTPQSSEKAAATA